MFCSLYIELIYISFSVSLKRTFSYYHFDCRQYYYDHYYYHYYNYYHYHLSYHHNYYEYIFFSEDNEIVRTTVAAMTTGDLSGLDIKVSTNRLIVRVC